MDDAIVSAYADDLWIAGCARYIDIIEAFIQPEVDNVDEWPDKAGLTFNSSQCETKFFSLDCAHAAC